MEIKVLGGGCSNCDILKAALEDVLETMGKSDVKIEKVSIQVAEKVTQQVIKAGKQIPLLLQIKEDVMNLAEEVKNQKGHNILSIIKR